MIIISECTVAGRFFIDLRRLRFNFLLFMVHVSTSTTSIQFVVESKKKNTTKIVYTVQSTDIRVESTFINLFILFLRKHGHAKIMCGNGQ